MKAKLIITLGTRDLQIKPEAEAKYKGEIFRDATGRVNNQIPKYAREFGAYLLEVQEDIPDEVDIDDFKLPMLKAALEYIGQKESTFDLVFIATNQEKNEANVRYWKQDSIHIATFLQKLISEAVNGNIEVVSIGGSHIQEMGAIYNQMRDELFLDEASPIYPQSAERFYVMPQGGIDSINTSLLLNGIEFYHEAIFLRKSESSDKAEEQIFPLQHKQRMLKSNIERLLDSHQFYAVSKLLPQDSDAYKLASFAHRRYILDHEAAWQLWSEINSNKDFLTENVEFKKAVGLSNDRNHVLHAKIKDILLSTKVDYENGDYSGALMKLFILQENFMDYLLRDFLPPLSEIFNPYLPKEAINKDWELEIKRIKSLLGKKNIKEVYLKNPSPNAYKSIWNALVTKDYISVSNKQHDLVNNCWKLLNKLKGLRNKLTHGGIGASKSLLDQTVVSCSVNMNNMDDLFKSLSKLYGVQGQGHFDLLRKEILRSL